MSLDDYPGLHPRFCTGDLVSDEYDFVRSMHGIDIVVRNNATPAYVRVIGPLVGFPDTHVCHGPPNAAALVNPAPNSFRLTEPQAREIEEFCATLTALIQ